MKIQKLLLVLFASFFLSLAFVSAATNFTASTPSALSQLTNTTTFTITAVANSTVTLSPSPLTFNGVTVSVSPTSAFVNTSSPTTITLTATTFPANFGSYVGSLLVSNGTDSQNVTVTFNKNLCSVANPAGLDVSNIEINVEEGFGSDEDYWYPLDEVSIDFDVDSPNYDVKDIEVTACLWDVSAAKCIIDEGDMDLSDDNFDLDEDEDTTITLTFQVDPDTLREGNTNYILYIGASGKINSDDTNDNLATCASDSQSVEIRTDEQFVIATNIQVSDLISCSSPFELTFDLWNVGDTDLDSDEIFVLLSNSELGINQVVELKNGLDAMDSVEITESLSILKNVSLKSYSLKIEAYDDEDLADKHLYQNSEDDDASWEVPIKVTSCYSSALGSGVNITNVELSDETPNAIVGSQLIVEATVKNTGDVAATYTIDVSGNSQWSNLATIDPKTITLNAGESKKVSVYLDVDNSATTGEKLFTIKASSGTSSTEQAVKVNLEKGITSSVIINHFKANWVIYTIVLVNLILIIAIILVVKSIVSSKD